MCVWLINWTSPYSIFKSFHMKMLSFLSQVTNFFSSFCSQFISFTVFKGRSWLMWYWSKIQSPPVNITMVYPILVFSFSFQNLIHIVLIIVSFIQIKYIFVKNVAYFCYMHIFGGYIGSFFFHWIKRMNFYFVMALYLESRMSHIYKEKF